MKIKKTQLLVSIMLVWALVIQFLPSSLSPTAINSNWIANYTRLGILFFVLFLVGTKKITTNVLAFQIINILLLFIFSWLTIKYKGFTEAYYNFYYYLLLACVLVMDLRNIKTGKYINLLFYSSVIAFCTMGILVILKDPNICEFLSTYYTRHWEFSTYYMTRAGKPVGTYAVHSIAGFMYFQFIVLLYYKNKNNPKWYNIALIVVLTIIIAMLRSNTSVMMLGIGALIILFEHKKRGSSRSFIFKSVFVIAICIFLIANMDEIQTITGSSENGLLGRFTGTSAFLSNITYIANNLLPIGFTGSNSLWLSDNGYIIAFLRGGIVNVIAIYGGLYLFLKRNISNKAARISILISLAAFEMAYPIVLEIRYLCFVPLMIIYLNTYAPKEQEQEEEVRNYERFSGHRAVQS